MKNISFVTLRMTYSFIIFNYFMDIISHGLRGGIAFGRKNRKQFRLAFAFGVLPDLLAFGYPFAVTIFTIVFLGGTRPNFQAGQHISGENYIRSIYSMSHSLIVWAVVFGSLWLIFKKPVIASFAWLLHILLDIPTHSLSFFATPFLWPISNYRFDGIPRHNPEIRYPDIALLIVIYGIFLWKKYRQRNR